MSIPFLKRRPCRGAWISILAFMMRLCCVGVIATIGVPSAHGQPRSDRKEPVAEPAIPPSRSR